MKKSILLLFVVLLIASCKQKTATTEVQTSTEDNVELQEMYKADQEDRQSQNIDWSKISDRDAKRRERVSELLNSNLVKTSNDYANAAMIFQHGGDTIASGMAVKLMRKAIELDGNRNKWLLAAAIDRDLMRRGQPQIYGTQYTKMGEGEPWKIHDLDTTKVSDKEREEYGVETLAEQKEKLRMMNKKDLNDFLSSGKSIDDLISYIKSADLKNSEYNLSEMGINIFGYQLMGTDKTADALKIFKLNTELYPEGFNTYDSYGECLVKLGKLKEGVIAYKKSLELNPKNENAKKVLSEINK